MRKDTLENIFSIEAASLYPIEGLIQQRCQLGLLSHAASITGSSVIAALTVESLTPGRLGLPSIVFLCYLAIQGFSSNIVQAF